MPAKNTIRSYDVPAFYHVYNRGANKAPVFVDDTDKKKFVSLLERYLDESRELVDSNGASYPKFDVEVVAYCVMDNHFHLLLYQEVDADALRGLMKSVATAYTMYFNRKYKHQGAVFQGVFRASRITNESYLLHITRYIHMNPRAYRSYPWSSLRYYLGEAYPSWANPDRASDMPTRQYREFMRSYEGKKAELEILKTELADQ